MIAELFTDPVGWLTDWRQWLEVAFIILGYEGMKWILNRIWP